MNLRMAFALATVALSGVACDDRAQGAAEVVGVEWTLESVRRADGTTVVAPPGRYTLTLDAEGRASVRSDCNRCGGGYSLAGSALAFGPLACTRAYCGDTSLDPEYPRILESGRVADVDGGRLEIAGPEGTLRYTR